jgi:hypothetical protein
MEILSLKLFLSLDPPSDCALKLDKTTGNYALLR